MRVFISWSGETSRQVAEALRGWLGKALQATRPWISVEDIEKGARWESEIVAKLNEATIGIVCLTPDNLQKPWLLFEAGAIAKSLHDKSRVCGYLFGLEPHHVQGPFGMFQLTKATDRTDNLRLFRTLNRALPTDRSLPSGDEDAVFDHWWPLLKDKFDSVAPPAEAPEEPSDKEILQEILAGVRSVQAINRGPAVGRVPAPIRPPWEISASGVPEPDVRVPLSNLVINPTANRTSEGYGPTVISVGKRD